MQAIVYTNYGSPDVLKLEETEPPLPDENQLLIKVHAVSINSWDWDMLTGKPFEYRLLSGLLKPKHSKIHGCDIAGRVEAIGKNVKHFSVGDEVFGDLGEGGWGAFAEYVCAFEKNLIHKPPDMTFEQAACLSHGGNLAVQGLVDYGKIKSGQKVLINGGCGSTGTLAIQIAKSFDVEVTGVDRAEKLDMMRSLGADHVIDYTEDDFTHTGHKYDLIFDVKTTRSIFDYKRALYPNGTYVTVGGHSSRILQLLVCRKFIGNYTMCMVAYTPNKDLKYLVELFTSAKLQPVIDRCFSLEQTAEAFRYYKDGSFKGKIVVTIDHDNTT